MSQQRFHCARAAGESRRLRRYLIAELLARRGPARSVAVAAIAYRASLDSAPGRGRRDPGRAVGLYDGCWRSTSDRQLKRRPVERAPHRSRRACAPSGEPG